MYYSDTVILDKCFKFVKKNVYLQVTTLGTFALYIAGRSLYRPTDLSSYSCTSCTHVYVVTITVRFMSFSFKHAMRLRRNSCKTHTHVRTRLEDVCYDTCTFFRCVDLHVCLRPATISFWA